nr:transposase [Sphingobacterium shayense]
MDGNRYRKDHYQRLESCSPRCSNDYGIRDFFKGHIWITIPSVLIFESVARSIAAHHPENLHYFDNRSTNASAESFNAKLKAFRSVFRGVRDTTFFLYRVMKLYA